MRSTPIDQEDPTLTSTTPAPHLELTARFADAVAWASTLHRTQTRKASTVPYVAHLLGAASFLIEQDGASEDEAIAALLHDAVEDQDVPVADIEARFGPVVASIVADCTDTFGEGEQPWRHRKVRYLAHLATAPVPSLRVSLADKLHNARAILTDVQLHGEDLWQRFNAPPVAQRWYYTALADTFVERLDGSPTAQAMRATVAAMVEGLPDRIALAPDDERPGWVDVTAITGAATDVRAAMARHDIHLRPLGRGHTDEHRRWWVEPVDAGDPNRPLTVFVAPEDGTS